MENKEFKLKNYIMYQDGIREDNLVVPVRNVKEFIKLVKNEFRFETYWQKVCKMLDKYSEFEDKGDLVK